MESFCKYFKCIEGSIVLWTQTVTAGVAHTLPAQVKTHSQDELGGERAAWQLVGSPALPTEKAFPFPPPHQASTLSVDASPEAVCLVLAAQL